MRIRWVIAASLMMMTCGIVARSEVLAEGGASGYTIVLAKGALPAEQRGAAEIRKHLIEMTGADIPVANETDALPEKAIVVGRLEQARDLLVGLDPKSLGEEGFVLRTVGERIIISGGGQRGTMYGCDEFLESLGVRWLTPEVTRVPRRAKLELPQLDTVQRPAFEYREPYITEAMDKDWAARLRMNGNSQRLDDSTGGKVMYGAFAHTLDTLVPRSLYAAHPEYFPLIDGKRKDGYVQRCLSNPQVLGLTIAQVRKWIADNPKATIFSVSQNDCAGWCQCDQCKAIAQEYGSQSGVYVWFVNQVAQAIAKDHPDKLIDTLAYQFTEPAPHGIRPLPNVRIRLCPISACVRTPTSSATIRRCACFMKNLNDWSALTDALYIWHYNANFANYLLPLPDFVEVPADIRMYRTHGVRGIFFEGDYAPGGGGAESELRAYLMAKLLWNDQADPQKLMDEWMEGVYGKPSPPMKAWLALLQEAVKGPAKHAHIYDRPTAFYLTSSIVARGDALFDQAEGLARGDAVAEKYVAKERLCLRYVKLMQKPTDGEAFTSFVRDAKRLGVTQMNEGRSTDAWASDYLAQFKRN